MFFSEWRTNADRVSMCIFAKEKNHLELILVSKLFFSLAAVLGKDSQV